MEAVPINLVMFWEKHNHHYTKLFTALLSYLSTWQRPALLLATKINQVIFAHGWTSEASSGDRGCHIQSVLPLKDTYYHFLSSLFYQA